MKWFSVPAILLVLCSCSKTSVSGINPGIELSGIPHDKLIPGSIVSIQSKISSPFPLKDIHFTIRENASRAVIMEFNKQPSGPEYSVSANFVADKGIDYRISIIATDSHGGSSQKVSLLSSK